MSSRLSFDTIGGRMRPAVMLYRSMGSVDSPPGLSSLVPDIARRELVP